MEGLPDITHCLKLFFYRPFRAGSSARPDLACHRFAATILVSRLDFVARRGTYIAKKLTSDCEQIRCKHGGPKAQKFLDVASFMTNLINVRSYIIHRSRLFSFCNCFRYLSCSAPIPGYLFFQRQYVCSVILLRRIASVRRMLCPICTSARRNFMTSSSGFALLMTFLGRPQFS